MLSYEQMIDKNYSREGSMESLGWGVREVADFVQGRSLTQKEAGFSEVCFGDILALLNTLIKSVYTVTFCLLGHLLIHLFSVVFTEHPLCSNFVRGAYSGDSNSSNSSGKK